MVESALVRFAHKVLIYNSVTSALSGRTFSALLAHGAAIVDGRWSIDDGDGSGFYVFYYGLLTVDCRLSYSALLVRP